MGLISRSTVENYIGDKKYVSFSPSCKCESTLNLGGERSRLWMLRQGKRAEEAGMISLTNNPCKKINADVKSSDFELAA